MKFSTREVIRCPADAVFAAMSDYGYFEAALRDRGVRIARVADGDAAGLGTTWEAETDLRGHLITVVTQVTEFTPGARIVSQSDAGGLEATATFAVEPLGPDKSRLMIGIDIRPTSFAGRMLLQPLKLAKGSIAERFERRVAAFARRVEEGAQV